MINVIGAAFLRSGVEARLLGGEDLAVRSTVSFAWILAAALAFAFSVLLAHGSALRDEQRFTI